MQTVPPLVRQFQQFNFLVVFCIDINLWDLFFAAGSLIDPSQTVTYSDPMRYVKRY